MSEPNSVNKKYVYQLGFWSAVAATSLVTIVGITATASIQPFASSWWNVDLNKAKMWSVKEG
jgi:hypothetical protein